MFKKYVKYFVGLALLLCCVVVYKIYWKTTDNNAPLAELDVSAKGLTNPEPPSVELPAIAETLTPVSPVSNASNSPLVDDEVIEDQLTEDASIEIAQEDEVVTNEPLDEMPPELLEKALGELDTLLVPPGFSPSGIDKLSTADLQDTISINELPAPIADQMRSDLEFREVNGFDKEETERASNVLSILNNLAGTSADIPGLTFVPTDLPASFLSAYQYQGYVYAIGAENESAHNTVKRVFTGLNDNSVFIIEETSLANGSATLTTEFVNAVVLNCPAIIVEKRNEEVGNYGQLNWNTRASGFTLFQYNKEPVLDGLIGIAHSLANMNSENHNCDPAEGGDNVKLGTNPDLPVQ